jgi:hypothetical protein
MSISAKQCDFPEPRPPKAPLYRAGLSKGKAHRGVCILSVVKACLGQSLMFFMMKMPFEFFLMTFFFF